MTANCWTGGWNKKVCSVCGDVEVDAKGQPVTYGWVGALGHDNELVKRTVANCFVGGGDNVKCKRCDYETIINWYGALGHKFGTPQAIPGAGGWAVIYCDRAGCGYSTFVIAPAPVAATQAAAPRVEVAVEEVVAEAVEDPVIEEITEPAIYEEVL